MFEQFSDRARQAVVQAQQEARRLDHNYIGTEHLLLGLIREGDGVAAKALELLGISLDAVRQQVEEIIGRGQQTLSGHFPFTPRAKRVLELSLREALQLGHKYIGTEHILLGLIREGEGVAAQVLVRLGCDLNRVRQEVIRLLTGHQGKDSKIAGSGPGERARAGLPEDFILGSAGWTAAWQRSSAGRACDPTWRTWTRRSPRCGRKRKPRSTGRIPTPVPPWAKGRSNCWPSGPAGSRSGRGPPLAAGRWPRNWTG